MSMDNPYAQIPVYKSTIEQEEKHVMYNQALGTLKQEGIDIEEDCNKDF